MIRTCDHCKRRNTPKQTTFISQCGENVPLCHHCGRVMHTQTLAVKALSHSRRVCLMRDESKHNGGRWAVRFYAPRHMPDDANGRKGEDACCGGSIYKTRQEARAIFNSVEA